MKIETKSSGGDSGAVPLIIGPFSEVINKAAGLVGRCGVMEHTFDFPVLPFQRVGHTSGGSDTRRLTVPLRSDFTSHLVCLQERIMIIMILFL